MVGFRVRLRVGFRVRFRVRLSVNKQLRIPGPGHTLSGFTIK